MDDGQRPPRLDREIPEMHPDFAQDEGVNKFSERVYNLWVARRWKITLIKKCAILKRISVLYQSNFLKLSQAVPGSPEHQEFSRIERSLVKREKRIRKRMSLI